MSVTWIQFTRLNLLLYFFRVLVILILCHFCHGFESVYYCLLLARSHCDQIGSTWSEFIYVHFPILIVDWRQIGFVLLVFTHFLKELVFAHLLFSHFSNHCCSLLLIHCNLFAKLKLFLSLSLQLGFKLPHLVSGSLATPLLVEAGKCFHPCFIPLLLHHFLKLLQPCVVLVNVILIWHLGGFDLFFLYRLSASEVLLGDYALPSWLLRWNVLAIWLLVREFLDVCGGEGVAPFPLLLVCGWGNLILVLQNCMPVLTDAILHDSLASVLWCCPTLFLVLFDLSLRVFEPHIKSIQIGQSWK